MVQLAGAEAVESPPQDADNLELLEKRKTFPGAASHNALFDEAETELQESIRKLAMTPRRVRPPKEGVIHVARRLQKDVQAACPGWEADMRRVATAGLVLYRLRTSDVASPELVQIVWACLGDVRLRSHKGMMYYYDTDHGSWRRYTGLFPEGMFVFLRNFMNKVEGCFRSFQGDVPWTQAGVLNEMKRIVDSRHGISLAAKQADALERFKNASFWNKGDGQGRKRRGGQAVDNAE